MFLALAAPDVLSPGCRSPCCFLASCSLLRHWTCQALARPTVILPCCCTNLLLSCDPVCIVFGGMHSQSHNGLPDLSTQTCPTTACSPLDEVINFNQLLVLKFWCVFFSFWIGAKRWKLDKTVNPWGHLEAHWIGLCSGSAVKALSCWDLQDATFIMSAVRGKQEIALIYKQAIQIVLSYNFLPTSECNSLGEK